MEIKSKVEEINNYIYEFLLDENTLSKNLIIAMNTAIKNGGKRIRPLLMYETYKMFGGSDVQLLKPFMAAIEFIHTFSLIHDDLPCIDNDILRRGKKSTWAEFGEATAVLAGDALFIEAFHLPLKYMSKIEDKDTLKRYSKALEILSYNSGIKGMIAGEAFDVEKTGLPINKEEIEYIYRLKTSALIVASMKIGAILAAASTDEIEIIENIALCLGMSFQIKDDILDETSTEEKLGKSIGSDIKNGKITYVKLFGITKAQQDISDYREFMIKNLKNFNKSKDLISLIEWLDKREK